MDDHKVFTAKMVSKTKQTILAKRRLRSKGKVDIVEISLKRVHKRLHKHLDMKPLCV